MARNVVSAKLDIIFLAIFFAHPVGSDDPVVFPIEKVFN